MSPQPPRKPYKIRTPETWDLIRSGYVRGESARSLAERFDVTEWAIRNRAKKQGWTKRAYAEGKAEAQALAHVQAQGAAEGWAALPPSHPGHGALDAPYPNAPDALPPLDAYSCAEPLDVMRVALAAVERSLIGGQYADAEKLGRLASILSELGDKERRRANTEAEERVLTVDDFMVLPPPPRDPGKPPPSPEHVEALSAQLTQKFKALAERLDRQGILEPILAMDPEVLRRMDAEKAFATYEHQRRQRLNGGRDWDD